MDGSCPWCVGWGYVHCVESAWAYQPTTPPCHPSPQPGFLLLTPTLLTPQPRVQSFENLEHWRTDFLHNASPPDPDNFPFLVLGNKCDLEGERKVAKQKALQWAKSKGPNVSRVEGGRSSVE